MTASAGSPTTIIIDLDHSDTNAKLEVNQLVQHQSYNKLRQRIAADLESFQRKLPTRAVGSAPPGSGLVYFIDGTRGAGKSTFLQSAFHALGNEKIGLNVSPLAYIDPSRIERSEIILLSILKALKDRITSFRKGASLAGEQLIERFREQFKKLAGGLSLFSSNHDQLQDLDPELFFEWGLERAGHSTELRKSLHELLELACTILDADALVLAFDDADTHAQHARSVLECIRKYLDIPSLVVLVTGDIELYSLMVRDHFYDSLGDAKHGQGKERADQRHKMVDHLEDQYLLKLFPMHRRLQLRPLWNLLQHDENRFRLTHSKWEKQLTAKELVSTLIRRGLRIKNPRDLELYQEFLLKQPLRSVLQVMSRCAPYLTSEGANDQTDTWDLELSEALSESLRALALGSLYKFGVDVDAIAAHELPALTKAVFDLAVRDGDFDTAVYLRPQPSDADLKNSFAALSADVTRLCAEKPAALIDYMLAAPGSVALFGQVLRRKGKDLQTEEARQSLRIQFEQYMGIGRKEDALNWARHAVAIFSAPHGANPKSPLVYSGIIGLNKGKPDHAPLESESGYKAAASVIRECPELPAFALSLVDVSGTSTRTYASIYNILGLIARLLSLQPKDGQYPVLSVLPKPFPPLSVSRPQWEADAADEEELEQDASEDAGKLSTLEASIKHWLAITVGVRKQLNPSAVLIGKIWTRLYFSLEKVCDANRPRVSSMSTGTAGLMELFALCVINAVYIEERDYHLSSSAGFTESSSALDRTNPLTSGKAFIEKFKDIKESHQKLPLTYLIATCPLLLGLLQATSKSKELVDGLLSCHPTSLAAQDELNGSRLGDSVLQAKDLMCSTKIWNKINKTYIAGTKWKKFTSNDLPQDSSDEESVES
ncbi:P-loop NTPase fold protein [Pseudomonas aeruginosa]|uniref:P-loop NTPase fold protein n=1 Tax=Pseudomonas aeruginosa TaxID=287 RepID=UPI000BB86B1A|nr:P-loop NTPase fold protein [Pseudomonas aeruginosa]MCV4025903.1 KAP family NTPase [Pseudomonas aeruginosa]MDP5379792.1 hypothetical protein [Pseudomonas aeruginosa]MDP5402748.1 hypothetical protein [Pseudomonas aeruginosa]NPZ09791.1 hypothetical protein [Pseudomonas aeruginosa]PBV39677.1 hypothetical protein CJU30_12385 [Pseudomonas aeruginosa]